MAAYYHISVAVRDMLDKADEALCELYRCDPEHIPEIRTRLLMALLRHHEYMPLNGECDNFDPARGCQGHAQRIKLTGPRSDERL